MDNVIVMTRGDLRKELMRLKQDMLNDNDKGSHENLVPGDVSSSPRGATVPAGGRRRDKKDHPLEGARGNTTWATPAILQDVDHEEIYCSPDSNQMISPLGTKLGGNAYDTDYGFNDRENKKRNVIKQLFLEMESIKMSLREEFDKLHNAITEQSFGEKRSGGLARRRKVSSKSPTFDTLVDVDDYTEVQPFSDDLHDSDTPGAFPQGPVKADGAAEDKPGKLGADKLGVPGAGGADSESNLKSFLSKAEHDFHAPRTTRRRTEDSKGRRSLIQVTKSLADTDDDDLSETEEKADLDGLQELLLTSEELAAEEEERSSMPLWARVVSFFREMDRERFEIVLEATIGSIIGLNTVFIGIEINFNHKASPSYNHPVWYICNTTICMIFVAELVLKLYLNGFAGHFCGKDKYMNCFDGCIVAADLVQIGFQFLPIKPSLFRLVRLIRLVRLLRLIRSPIFADLLAMVQGILGAIGTLAWALLLLLVMVYFFALLFMVLVREEEVEKVSEYFADVPRAFLTIFRCSFGDCSTDGGTPIFEHMYGDPKTQFYVAIFAMFGFFFWVGLFNVISAIFVESTMAAAAGLAKNKKAQRLENKLLWSRCISVLVKVLWKKAGNEECKLSGCVEEVAELDLPCADVQEAVLTPEARRALLDLDICEEDHTHLADILDPDNGGTIGVLDLMDGLGRMRGEPRRSDIITIDLMVRALQHSLGDVIKDIRWMRMKMIRQAANSKTR